MAVPTRDGLREAVALASALKEVGVSLGAAVACAPLAMSAKPQRLLYARQGLEGLLDSMEISGYEIETEIS